MLIDELLNLILFASLSSFFAFFWFFAFWLWGLLLSSLLIFLFVEISSFIGHITKLMHFQEFFHPFSSLVKHLLLNTGLFSFLYLHN